MKTSDLTHIALVQLFVCSCSNLFATTSFSCTFTLQVFAIFFLSVLMPPRQSLMTVLMYILLGALGLPVFAGGVWGLVF